ncbi:uncharacterized protein LOC141903805 [Tubulanus polymorphus]|uniref:uncharacterized protein LOC141903805 n=1 Tax=Tubulanus polymorphus TaxID=672921 RepID=UPI003DA4222B
MIAIQTGVGLLCVLCVATSQALAFSHSANDVLTNERGTNKIGKDKCESDKCKCFQGPMGQPGNHGMPGLPGTRGDDGKHGSKGEKGEAGPIGPPGELGLAGNRGKRGVKGERGEQGERGIMGERGEPGFPGLDGQRGAKGDPGTNILNKIAFSASRSKKLGPVLQNTIIVFENVHTNIGDGFDVYTSHFVCRRNGTYVFIAHILGQEKQDAEAWIVVNNQHKVPLHGDARAGYGTGSNTIILHLNLDDHVWIELSKNTAIFSDYTTFSGFLLFPD